MVAEPSLRRHPVLANTVLRNLTRRTRVGRLVARVLEQQRHDAMRRHRARGEVADSSAVVRVRPEILHTATRQQHIPLAWET